MAYISPFSKIENLNKGDFSYYSFLDCGIYLKYRGTLGKVVNELHNLIDSGVNNEKDAVNYALHPTRLIRGVLDYNVRNPKKQIDPYVIRDISNFALDVYRDDYNISDLENITGFLRSYNNGKPLKTVINQKKDNISWSAYYADLSEKTANEVIEFAGDDKLMFIAIGHGGIPAGLDVFSHYFEVGNPNSIFYPVRFSRRKLRDKEPRFDIAEEEYLIELSNGNKTLIFDEDSISGKTINGAKDYFSRIFNKEIYTITNTESLK